MKDIPQIERMVAGEDGWSEWIHPAPGFLMQCCDCGLIHDAEFQLARPNPGETDFNPGEGEHGVAIFRMRRHRFDALAAMTLLDEQLDAEHPGWMVGEERPHA